MVRPVARFSATPNAIRMPPPTLGQHTEEVLHALELNGWPNQATAGGKL
jgi:crotonobetainyl-CoA:carnitine CoA-transferase CaiB-like acyl-CoA transferase